MSRRREARAGGATGRPLAALAATLVLAFGLAACGGQASSGQSALPDATGSASAAAPVASASSSAPARSPGAVATGAARTEAAAFERLFAYDASEPLDLRIKGRDVWAGATVRRVTYRSAGTTVTGYLSLPAGGGRVPAVLYAPGVGCAASMFAADVAALQKAGIAVLSVDPPDGRPPAVEPASLDAEAVAAAHVQYVTDLRRGLDLLAGLPRVDPGRLGYVGFSWGGYAGGLLAGLRSPATAYVLTYAGPDWITADPTEVGGFLDPAEAVGFSHGAAFLFQAGTADPLFSRAGVRRYYGAAPGTKLLRWYAGGHGDFWQEPDGAAVTFHRRWLEQNL